MKIGILTLPIAENYGGILQAVALYQFLEQQGHDVSLIYKVNATKPWKEAIKRILELLPCHDLFNVHTNKKLREASAERTKLHQNFIHQEIENISPSLLTTQDLKNYAKETNFDAVIVGSDQVWRKAYINDEYYKSYFLDFIDGDAKKIAYAASFGRDVWEGEDDHGEISELLKKFTGISVREASGIDICRNIFEIEDVEHVLDPTLLMDKQFYLDMISQYDVENVKSKKLVTYVLDESYDKKDIISLYQSRLGILDNEVLNLKGFNQSNRTYTIPEWLYAIANADFVVTDSFHGMVFSILFEKQFIVIGNKDRGLARFTSLLSMINLSDRICDSGDFNHEKMMKDKIDYSDVKIKLAELQKRSKSFLQLALQ